jgi:hypothetical protein
MSASFFSGESLSTRMAELSGLGGSAPTYSRSLPAACANTGGESPVRPNSRLPTASASSNCGPAGNSTQLTLVPGRRCSSQPDCLTITRLAADFW